MNKRLCYMLIAALSVQSVTTSYAYESNLKTLQSYSTVEKNIEKVGEDIIQIGFEDYLGDNKEASSITWDKDSKKTFTQDGFVEDVRYSKAIEAGYEEKSLMLYTSLPLAEEVINTYEKTTPTTSLSVPMTTSSALTIENKDLKFSAWDLDIQDKFVIENNFKFEDNNSAKTLFQGKYRNSEGKEQWLSNLAIKIDQDNNLCINGKKIEECDTNQWYNLKMVFDTDKREVNYLLDDKHITTVNLQEDFKALIAIEFLQLHNNNSTQPSKTYLDNLSVYPFKYIDEVDSSKLKSRIEEAKERLGVAKSNIGDELGQYPEQRVKELERVIEGSERLLSMSIEDLLQKDIDSQTVELEQAIRECIPYVTPIVPIRMITTNDMEDYKGTSTSAAGLSFWGNPRDFETEKRYMEAETVEEAKGKSLKIVTKSDASGSLGFFKSGTKDKGALAFEFDVYCKDFNSKKTIYEVKYDGKNFFDVCTIDTQGNVKLGEAYTTKINTDQWYNFRVEMDAPSKQMRVFINNQLVHIGELADKCLGEITQYKINQDKPVVDETVMYLDNIKIYEYTNEIPITSIILNQEEAMIRVLEFLKLEAKVSEGSNEKIIWESMNTNIATVNQEGLVYGVGEGTTQIKVRAERSQVEAIATIQVDEAQLAWDSTKVNHPVDNIINVLDYSDRSSAMNETEETLKEAVAPYIVLTEEEFIEEIDRQIKYEWKNNMTHIPAVKIARKMAMLYNLGVEDKEVYAERAATILYRMAMKYTEIPKVSAREEFKFNQFCIPQDAVYAYDLIYNTTAWGELDNAEARLHVENWIREAALLIESEYESHAMLNNLHPYGIRKASAVGLVLNDPEIVRMAIKQTDKLMSGRHFGADGMWFEGTPDYHDQVIGNTSLAVGLLSQYKDPEGYTDNELDLVLAGKDLSERWPLLQVGKDIKARMVYPDGDKIPLHDTHYIKPVKDNLENNKPKKEHLDNIELWDFGYFGLRSGNEENALHVGLAMPPIANGVPYSGGHYHGNFLAIDLWGAGQELLPDSGYMPSGGNRFFYNSPLAHNTAWITTKEEDKTLGNEKLGRRSMIAYDPGITSDNKIQLVEGSWLGPQQENIEMHRRLLMTVNVDDNRSYVVDLQRLQGGDTHELYLRSSEDEDILFTTNIELEETNSPNLEDYLKSTGNTQGFNGYKKHLKSPKIAEGKDAFDFTWTGKKSGSSLRAFMNGEDDEVYFTMMPTLRRTENKIDQKDNYPNPHLARRKLVEQDAVTKYGAVYDMWTKDQEGLVEQVEWIEPEDKDPYTYLIKVTTKEYVDCIYISNDEKEREIEGITFSGTTAMLRKKRNNEKIQTTYVYGDGKIDIENKNIVRGIPSQKVQVISTQGSLDGMVENVIGLEERVDKIKQFEGTWAMIDIGNPQNGSSYGYAMEIVKTKGKDRLEVHSQPPFSIVDEGTRLDYFPSIAKYKEPITEGEELIIPGETYITLKTSIFEDKPNKLNKPNKPS